MLKLTMPILAISIAITTISAFAHTGAKGVVKARMDSMGQIKEGMKTLGTMAAGKTQFDAVQAKAAANLIEEHANDIAMLFEMQDLSAPSEARKEIWTNWEDFVAQAESLAKTAKTAGSNSDSLDGVRASVPELGKSCKNCHQDYRI